MAQFKETYHQALSVATVAMNEFSLGIGNGWVAPTLNALQKSGSDLHLTMDECSWIASLEHIGKVFGALLSACLLDTLGRTPLLALCALIFLLMWLGILFTKSVAVLYIIRILFGLANGTNDGTNSVYLGENSSPITRGIFGTVIMSMYHVGLLFEFVVAGYFSYNTVAGINTFVEVLCFVSVFWMVEPVQFLLMKGRLEQAEKNFMWLKGVKDPNDVKNEFEKIKQNVYVENSKKSSYKKIITSRANYKSVLIMLTMYLLSGSTGFYPIMAFASMAFSSTDFLSANELTILFGVSQLVVVISASFIIDQFSRRTIMLISYSLIALTHASTAALYYVQEHVSEIPYFPWLIFCTITLYASIYAFVYPAVFLIRSELFPLSIKAVGGCISVTGYSMMSFLMTKIFLFVFKNYGIYINFLLFAVISLIMVLFVYWILPETRNKSLIEIQETLEKEN